MLLRKKGLQHEALFGLLCGRGLNPDATMKMITNFGRWMGQLFGTRNDKLSKSRLVGMYLSQTNTKDAYGSEFQESRQRRNGKYATRRERA